MQNNLNQVYAAYLKNLGIPDFNSMQLEVIEKAGVANDLMVLAPTGSGKTLPFLVAVVNKMNPKATGVQAMVVAPSRELALQIEQVFRNMKTSLRLSCSVLNE